MSLSNLVSVPGSRKRKKTLGRGDASGHGGTSTKGHKGQKARSSVHIARGFEGGQMPLHRRSPKWGFTSRNKIDFNIVNIADLEAAFPANAEVTLESLFSKKLARRKARPTKILGSGKLTKKLSVVAHAFSESAKKAIEAAQGSVKVLGKTKG